MLHVYLNVFLPFSDHNLSHIYLKTYIVPDHKKATKRKTPLLTLGRKDGSQSSSSNVTSWDGEEDDHGKRSGKRAGQRLVSSLKRGTRFSLKKKREKDQGILINCTISCVNFTLYFFSVLIESYRLKKNKKQYSKLLSGSFICLSCKS